MAGVKRRSGYRKNVTAGVLDELPEPEEGQLIAQITGTRGGNLLQVESETGGTGLCLLPTKYRKLVWVKRGDFLIVSGSDADVEISGGGKGKVKYMVEAILMKDQMKHLQRIGRWPAHFKDRATIAADATAAATAASTSTSAPVAGGGVEESKCGSTSGEGAGAGSSVTATPSTADTVPGVAEAEEEDDDDGDDDEEEGSMDGVFQNVNRRRYVRGAAPESDTDDSEDDSSDGF